MTPQLLASMRRDCEAGAALRSAQQRYLPLHVGLQSPAARERTCALLRARATPDLAPGAMGAHCSLTARKFPPDTVAAVRALMLQSCALHGGGGSSGNSTQGEEVALLGRGVCAAAAQAAAAGRRGIRQP